MAIKKTQKKKTAKPTKAVKKSIVKSMKTKSCNKKAVVKIKTKESNVTNKKTSSIKSSKTLSAKSNTKASVKSSAKLVPKKTSKKDIEVALASKKIAAIKNTKTGSKSVDKNNPEKNINISKQPLKTILRTLPKENTKSKKTAATIFKSEPSLKNNLVVFRKLENKAKYLVNDNTDSGCINYTASRSLLDNPSKVSLRYSDSDLNEFKALINKRLNSAQQELNYLQGIIINKEGSEKNITKSGSAYDGDDPNEMEHISHLVDRQIKFINHLKNALIRIENKTYGICRVTGRLIQKERLIAVPHATLSIEAKQEISKA